ncbi:unnamed protein product, partial [marine sediment metagenome]
RAIKYCNDLVPPPALGVQAAVVNLGNGSFDTSVGGSGDANLDSIQFLSSGANLVNSQGDPYTVSLGSLTNFLTTTVTNATLDGCAALCEDKIRTGCDVKFMAAIGGGANAAALRVTGTVNDLFVNIGQIAVFTGYGVNDDTANTNPISYALNEMTLDGNNVTGFHFTDGIKTINVGSIKVSGAFTGTTCFDCDGGQVDITATSIEAVMIIDADGTADVSATVSRASGDISLASGTNVDTNISSMNGDIDVSGCYFGNISRHIGDATVQSGGELHYRSSSLTGNASVLSGGVGYLNCNKLTGD